MSCFSLVFSVTTPRYLLTWSVTGQCFWHPWWECGRQWDCCCNNKRGWTAALDPSVFGPELLSLSTCRVCHRGRSVVQCLLLTYLFCLFSIGRVINGESCWWLSFCWKHLVFILWADSGSQFGILIHVERSLWPPGPRNSMKSHTLWFLFITCMYI